MHEVSMLRFHMAERRRLDWRMQHLHILFTDAALESRRGLEMRILSVCLSVKRVHCDKTEERSIQIFLPYERSFNLVFWA